MELLLMRPPALSIILSHRALPSTGLKQVGYPHPESRGGGLLKKPCLYPTPDLLNLNLLEIQPLNPYIQKNFDNSSHVREPREHD